LIERLSTGDARLDDILCGGLIANAITLLAGEPGTGKTILAEQCLFHNASRERPALYLSTVSEPFDKLLRYGQSLDFFDVKQIGESVFYDDLGDALNRDGLAGVLERVDALVKEHRPGILVIDSFKAMRDFAVDDGDFRRFLHELSRRLSAVAISSFWVGEYVTQEARECPEFGIADAVIHLESKWTAERVGRHLRVLKLRGSGFLSGEHAYRITAAGVEAFPRLADARVETGHETLGGRVSTGIVALDQALGDGYWPGSTTLIAGPGGAGKTVMGLHFLYRGAERGEPGILVTLQENRTQLLQNINQFGWTVDGAVTIMDRSPVDLLVDELAYELLDCIAVTGARRIVIDSIGDLQLSSPDPTRFREFVRSIVQRCAQMGVSLLFTYETPELFRVTQLGEAGMSHLSDNVVLLQHIHDGDQMKRALTVLKTRGSGSDPAIREFHIADDGITLGEPINLQTLLT
jgi:circadian clock protein KaiC